MHLIPILLLNILCINANPIAIKWHVIHYTPTITETVYATPTPSEIVTMTLTVQK